MTKEELYKVLEKKLNKYLNAKSYTIKEEAIREGLVAVFENIQNMQYSGIHKLKSAHYYYNLAFGVASNYISREMLYQHRFESMNNDSLEASGYCKRLSLRRV